MAALAAPHRRSQNPWIISNSGNIYYRADCSTEASATLGRPVTPSAAFPAPLIGPRRSRPHSIHIVTYPSGYIPRDLRPRPSNNTSSSSGNISGSNNNNNNSNISSSSSSGHGYDAQREAASRVGRVEQAQQLQQLQQQQQQQLQQLRQHQLQQLQPQEGPHPHSQQYHQQRHHPQHHPQHHHHHHQPHHPRHSRQSSLRRLALPSRAKRQRDSIANRAAAADASTADASSSTGTTTGSTAYTTASTSTRDTTKRRRSFQPAPALSKLLASLSSARRVSSTTISAPGGPTAASALGGDGDGDSTARPVSTIADSTRLDDQQQPTMAAAAFAARGGASWTGPPTPTGTGTPTPTSPAFHVNSGNRNSLMSVRSAKSAVNSLVTEVPKPVASGSGVTCSILMAEPNMFLSGFDHHHNAHDDSNAATHDMGTALLRGKLRITVSKNVKVKAVQLKLLGRARTEWPEGIPPLKQDVVEEESLRTQVLTFFNAINGGWETEFGNQCSFQLRGPSGSSSSASSSSSSLKAVYGMRPSSSSGAPPSALLATVAAGSHRAALTPKELKRLSLQSVNSRSFAKGDHGVATTTQAKGHKIFSPGIYDYSFELPIDHHQLETTKLQYGSVRWELHATVDRAGAFKPNLHGIKELSIVRLPDQMSLETTEPISISRQWEDQLHYDIVISGKSFPIGSKIPIAFKLTPLAKVQVHKLKVYVTESIEYWTNDRRVTRKDPGRKILLLEKAAGKPLDPAWASSDLVTVRGGEPTPDERRVARDIAALNRATQRRNTASSLYQPDGAYAAYDDGSLPSGPLPDPTPNLLGDLDLGLESMWASTELEANVQLPTCDMMAKNKDLRLNPDCSWKNVNVYHWIKIVMRISRLDPDDASGTKRRHFEISIDSPFTVLNCRATQANTSLPAYSIPACPSAPPCAPAPYQPACGCPDAAPVAAASMAPSATLLSVAHDVLPAPPQAAHLDGGAAPHYSPHYSPNHDARPMHLLRAPSFNPPAFDADVAPPPAIVIDDGSSSHFDTPPPQYDVVVGTPSVDGLADYFARLADYGLDDDVDSGSDSDEQHPAHHHARILDRSGRVNVSHPRTPGGRMPSRSMEISRPPVRLDPDMLLQRRPGPPLGS